MKYVLGLLLISIVVSCSPAKETSSPFDWKTTSIQIGEHSLDIEIADTSEKMARGLMFRKSLPENQGMLFIFQRPRQASFWMKNTFIPLSIAYLNQEGTILEIYPLEPLEESPVSSQSYRVAYALEVNRGWFRKHGIQPGIRIQNLPTHQLP